MSRSRESRRKEKKKRVQKHQKRTLQSDRVRQGRIQKTEVHAESEWNTDQEPALPPRFEMERIMRDLHRFLDEHEITSDEQMKMLVEQFNRSSGDRLKGRRGSLDDREVAQDLAYQAMEAEDAEEAIALVDEALSLDPDCVDALVCRAMALSRSPRQWIMNLKAAVRAGKRVLGREFIEENKGHFWGIFETRPYMRAKQALADVYRKLGRFPEAIAEYESMLELNPNDNQGVRDSLIGCYLVERDLDGARRLFDRYKCDFSAVYSWGRVLERFLTEDKPGTTRALRKARKCNPHVEPFLTGRAHVPRSLPDYYKPGDVTEAFHCMDNLAEAWKRHPKAIAWLKAQAGGS